MCVDKLATTTKHQKIKNDINVRDNKYIRKIFLKLPIFLKRQKKQLTKKYFSI